MPVMITADALQQTQEGYDTMFHQLAAGRAQTPGFVLHTAHPIEGGWRVFEVWESRAAAMAFYAAHVAPNLPPGVRPKLQIQELHSLQTMDDGH
jgi:quinol monooxygenase YgiN